MLDLAILGLLEDQPLHGYELKKRLADVVGTLWGVSFGSLYPALRRLERAGAILDEESAATVRSSVIPATGSIGGESAAARRRLVAKPGRRGRRSYQITPHGEELFQRMLADPAGVDDDRLFALKIAFARHLTTRARMELLQRRRAALAARLDHDRHSRRPGDRYTHSLAEHRRRGVEADLGWVDELIAAELGRPASP